jgi:PIN domain nuclease of toxin-antitoxin system
LLDTHLLIWAGNDPKRLPVRAAAAIREPANRLVFSTISVAEVAIKFALGRPDFPIDPEDFRGRLLGSGYEELSLSGDHAVRLRDLPPIHRDPFDRLLVAQAMAERVDLLTSDPVLARYGGRVRLV